MPSSNFTKAEAAAFRRDHELYYKAEEEAERIRVRKEDCLKFALEDIQYFRTLEDEHEIIDVDLVFRMLRNLNDACQSKDVARKQIAYDAITTCLNQMYRKLENACDWEVEQSEKYK